MLEMTSHARALGLKSGWCEFARRRGSTASPTDPLVCRGPQMPTTAIAPRTGQCMFRAGGRLRHQGRSLGRGVRVCADRTPIRCRVRRSAVQSTGAVSTQPLTHLSSRRSAVATKAQALAGTNLKTASFTTRGMFKRLSTSDFRPSSSTRVESSAT